MANISAMSGLDFPDDGRAVAITDWDHDGDVDVWISNRNAPRVRFMRNDTPSDNHFLSLRLIGNGVTSNRDAIGARVEVRLLDHNHNSQLNNHTLIKTLRAGDGFLAQSSKWMHFGLGAARTIERVIVRWPMANQPNEISVQHYTDIEVDHRYTLRQQHSAAIDTRWATRELALEPSNQESHTPMSNARVPLAVLVPLPPLSYETFGGGQRSIPTTSDQSLLINLWSTTCAPCIKELSELTRRSEEIRAAGIDVLALTVDGIGRSNKEVDASRRFLERISFPFRAGRATTQLVAKLQQAFDYTIPLQRTLALPSSVLIDAKGQMVALYRGPVSVDDLLEDALHAKLPRIARIQNDLDRQFRLGRLPEFG